ncbi:MAG TPA: hypothetical protein VHC95_06705 [Opitutales bacterium]|nr:hypothetical protein [Opitutales bacterium]
MDAAQSAKMPSIERMAPGLVRVTFPQSKTCQPKAAEAETRRSEVLVSGLAARAWEETSGMGVLSEYIPASWHDPRGLRKILRRLLPRLPDVSGGLFLTLTFDRNLFADAGSAHDTGRPQIRKVMEKLREGVTWNGKLYRIKAAYCVKVEFHNDDWPHYHLILLTRRYVPVELLAELWGNGICHVRRINNHKFHYLLKYVTKSGRYPDWVLGRKRLRVFQPSHGFMVSAGTPALTEEPRRQLRPRKRASYTIGQRLYRWSHMALFNQNGKFYSTIPLARPFRQTFDVLVLSIAEANRYLGNGFVKINEPKELMPWMLN